MTCLDSFLQWRVVRGTKSAIIHVIDFEDGEERPAPVKDWPDKRIIVAELHPLPEGVKKEDLPQGWGKSIAEAAECLAKNLELRGKGDLLK